MDSLSLSREDHRAEYARLLGRLVSAYRLPSAERAKWAPLLHSVAVECNRHRSSLLFMTEGAADTAFGTVLDRARDIAGTPPGPFTTADEIAAALGATIVGEVVP